MYISVLYVKYCLLIAAYCMKDGNIVELFTISLWVLTLCVVHCNVYTVVPDDEWHNLRYYLLNTTKYLNDNTQLKLLPGVHYLHVDLVLQNIYNFSLIGTFSNNGKSHTVIQCANPSSITVVNTTELRMQYITIANCTKTRFPEGYIFPYHYSVHTIQLYHCSSVIIQNVTILSRSIYDSLLSINTCGHSAFHHFTGAGIKVIYKDSEAIPYINSTCHLAINNYKYFCDSKCPRNHMITFAANQTSFSVYIELVNTNLCRNRIINLVYISVSQGSRSVVEVSYCTCAGELITSSHSTRELFDIEEMCNSCSYTNEVKTAVHFKGCQFTNIIPIKREIVIIKLTAKQCNQPNICSTMTMTDCTIINSSNVVNCDSFNLAKFSY